MSNWQIEKDDPVGMISHKELLALLKALAMTDCDHRTLEIVAYAVGLEKWWTEPVRLAIEKPPVYLLSD